MNSAPEPASPDQFSGFNSRDCVDVFVEIVGDKTVRPLRPELLRLALADKERLARLQEQVDEKKSRGQVADAPGAGNGSPEK